MVLVVLVWSLSFRIIKIIYLPRPETDHVHDGVHKHTCLIGISMASQWHLNGHIRTFLANRRIRVSDGSNREFRE